MNDVIVVSCAQWYAQSEWAYKTPSVHTCRGHKFSFCLTGSWTKKKKQLQVLYETRRQVVIPWSSTALLTKPGETPASWSWVCVDQPRSMTSWSNSTRSNRLLPAQCTTESRRSFLAVAIRLYNSSFRLFTDALRICGTSCTFLMTATYNKQPNARQGHCNVRFCLSFWYLHFTLVC